MRLDGHTRMVEVGDIQLGAIMRQLNSDGSSPPFSDSIITKVDGDVVFLSRPYLYAQRVTKSELSGVENFAVTISRLCDGSSIFRTVLDSRNRTYKMAIGE